MQQALFRVTRYGLDDRRKLVSFSAEARDFPSFRQHPAWVCWPQIFLFSGH